MNSSSSINSSGDDLNQRAINNERSNLSLSLSLWRTSAFAGEFADKFIDNTNLEGGHCADAAAVLLEVVASMMPAMAMTSMPMPMPMTSESGATHHSILTDGTSPPSLSSSAGRMHLYSVDARCLAAINKITELLNTAMKIDELLRKAAGAPGSAVDLIDFVLGMYSLATTALIPLKLIKFSIFSFSFSFFFSISFYFYFCMPRK